MSFPTGGGFHSRPRIPSVCALVASRRYSGLVVLDGMGVRVSHAINVRESPARLRCLRARLDRLIKTDRPTALVLAPLDPNDRSLRGTVEQLARRVRADVPHVSVEPVGASTQGFEGSQRALADLLTTSIIPARMSRSKPSRDRLRYDRPRFLALVLALCALADRHPYACAALLPPDVPAFRSIHARIERALTLPPHSL